MGADMENWLPVVGYEDYYEVSDAGRVRSLDRDVASVNPYGSYVRRVPGRVLSPCTDRGGYNRVVLCVDANKRDVFVHHLVLEAFVAPRKAGLQSRHLNGVALDNRAENLEWGTAQENSDDKVRHGTMVNGGRVQSAKLDELDVICIRHWAADGRWTNKEIASHFGVTREAIRAVYSRKTWAHV